jgi:hypothetical protein
VEKGGYPLGDEAKIVAAEMSGVPLLTGGVLLHTPEAAGFESFGHLVLTTDLRLKEECLLSVVESANCQEVETWIPLPIFIGLHSMRVSPVTSTPDKPTLGIYRRKEPVQGADPAEWQTYALVHRTESDERKAPVALNLVEEFKKRRRELPILYVISEVREQSGVLDAARKAGLKRVGLEVTEREFAQHRTAFEALQRKFRLTLIPLTNDEDYDRHRVVLESGLALDAEGRFDLKLLEDRCERLECEIKLASAHFMESFLTWSPERLESFGGEQQECEDSLARWKGPVRRFIESIGADPGKYREELDRFWQVSTEEFAERMRETKPDLVIVKRQRAELLAGRLGKSYIDGTNRSLRTTSPR